MWPHPAPVFPATRIQLKVYTGLWERRTRTLHMSKQGTCAHPHGTLCGCSHLHKLLAKNGLQRAQLVCLLLRICMRRSMRRGTVVWEKCRRPKQVAAAAAAVAVRCVACYRGQHKWRHHESKLHQSKRQHRQAAEQADSPSSAIVQALPSPNYRVYYSIANADINRAGQAAKQVPGRQCNSGHAP